MASEFLKSFSCEERAAGFTSDHLLLLSEKPRHAVSEFWGGKMSHGSKRAS
jgi:hypothetical protein